MSNVKRLKDKDGNNIYPVTHASAVFDNDGNNILELLDNLDVNVDKDEYVLNVAEKFELDITGSEDCSVKINEALAYAKEHNINTLFFKSGLYRLNNSVVLNSDHNDIRIIGENCRTTTFVSHTENIIMFDIQKGYRHTIENIGFKGSWNVKQTAIGKSTENEYTARQTFKHLYFNNIQYGIIINSGYMDAPILYDLWFQTVMGCISLKHCEGGVIQKIVAEPFVNYVFKLYQSNSMVIRDVLANTSSDIYGKATEDAYSCVAILLGAKASGQTFGTSITFDGVHSEYVHQFAFVGIPNVNFNDIYIYNGGADSIVKQLKHTFYFASYGGLHPSNCSLNRIFIDDVVKNEDIYDIFKSDSSIRQYLLSDGSQIDTPIGNLTNLSVNGFNGTVSIPDKVADRVHTSYNIKDGDYRLVNGVLFYEYRDVIPDSPKAFGISAWRDKDKMANGEKIIYEYNATANIWSSNDMVVSIITQSVASYTYTVVDDWTTILLSAVARSGSNPAGNAMCIIRSASISAGVKTLTCTRLTEDVDPISIEIIDNTIKINNRYQGVMYIKMIRM